jgi:hypothetical protein
MVVTNVTTWSTVVVVTVVAVGCSRHEEQQVVTAGEATRIASVRPAAEGWVWPLSPEQPVSPEDESGHSDPLLDKFKRQTADLKDIGDEATSWRDDDKLGNLTVAVYATTADAHRAFAPSNALALGWAKRTGTVTKAEMIDGLGDEAWLLWVGGNGTQATYHWRRGNLLLEAHVHCYGTCPGEADTAARAWAEAIDQAAQSDP